MKGSSMIRMENFSLLRTGLLKRYFHFCSARLHSCQLLDLTMSIYPYRRASVRTLQRSIGTKDTASKILFLAFLQTLLQQY